MSNIQLFLPVLAEDGALAEIGPRFVLNPVKIFADSFCGETLWENPNYQTPASHRRLLRKAAKDKYVNRTEARARHDANPPTEAFNIDKVGNQVFVDDEEEMAEKLVAQEADHDDDDHMESEDEEKEKKREQADIIRVKELIEKLKPGREGKTLVRPKKYVLPNASGKITKKATNKKSKMIQNIIKTKKLSTKVKKPKRKESY